MPKFEVVIDRTYIETIDASTLTQATEQAKENVRMHLKVTQVADFKKGA